jgi:hypothetical protein
MVRSPAPRSGGAAYTHGGRRDFNELHEAWRSSSLRRGANNVKLAVTLSTVTFALCLVAWCVPARGRFFLDSGEFSPVVLDVSAGWPSRLWGGAALRPLDRQQQDWFFKCLQGGHAHPLAPCGVVSLARFLARPFF